MPTLKDIGFRGSIFIRNNLIILVLILVLYQLTLCVLVFCFNARIKSRECDPQIFKNDQFLNYYMCAPKNIREFRSTNIFPSKSNVTASVRTEWIRLEFINHRLKTILTEHIKKLYKNKYLHLLNVIARPTVTLYNGKYYFNKPFQLKLTL